MIVEVWVIVTGNGDRPYLQSKRPSREVIDKWHAEEGGVRVLHLTANVADEVADPNRCWATVVEESALVDELSKLRRAIEMLVGVLRRGTT